MDARTAQAHFKEADALYRDGRHSEALDLLIELDEAFPNTPNILFPLARCLRHVGRVDEALAICDDLITRYGDLRALEMREYIRRSRPREREEPVHPRVHSIEGLNQDVHVGALDDLLGPAAPPLPPLPKTAAPKPYLKYAIGGGVFLVMFVTAFAVVAGLRGGPPPPAVATTPRPVTPAPAPGVPDAQLPPAEMSVEQLAAQNESARHALETIAAVLIVVIVVSNFAALYLALLITGKLPYDSVTDNLINVGFMSIALSLFNTFLPCIGLLPSFFVLYKAYEFRFVDFLIWLGMNIAVGFGLWIVAQLLFAATGVGVA